MNGREAPPGATWFFTLDLAERGSRLLTDRIDALRASFVAVLARRPFRIDAIVVMPDHLHLLCTLPDADHASRLAQLKAGFSRQIRRQAGARASPWRARYRQRRIGDRRDFARHLDYVHTDPVRHGYVPQPADWPYSSVHRWNARRGIGAGGGRGAQTTETTETTDATETPAGGRARRDRRLSHRR